eukprot:gene10011-6990_t
MLRGLAITGWGPGQQQQQQQRPDNDGRDGTDAPAPPTLEHRGTADVLPVDLTDREALRRGKEVLASRRHLLRTQSPADRAALLQCGTGLLLQRSRSKEHDHNVLAAAPVEPSSKSPSITTTGDGSSGLGGPAAAPIAPPVIPSAAAQGEGSSRGLHPPGEPCTIPYPTQLTRIALHDPSREAGLAPHTPMGLQSDSVSLPTTAPGFLPGEVHSMLENENIGLDVKDLVLREKSQRVMEELQRFQREAQRHAEEEKAWTEERERLTRELEALRDERKDRGDSISKTAHQETLSQLYAQFNDHLKSCQDKASAYQDTLKAHYEAVIQSNLEEQQALQDKLAALAAQLDTFAATNASLTSSYQHLDQLAKQQAEELEALRSAPPPPPPTDLVAANEAMAAQIANLERQVQDLLHARQELEGVIESQEEEVKALRSAPPPPPPTDLVAANEAMAAQIANLERQVQDLLHARQELEGVIESQEEEVKALRSAPPPPPPTDLVAANEAMAAQIANLERQVQDLLHARQELEGVIESQEEEVKALRSAPPPPPPTDLVAANEAMAAQIANLERQVQDLLHARQELEGVIESQEEEVKALRSAPPPPPPTDLVAANEAMAAQIANLERQVQDLLHARQELEGVIESQEEEVKALRSAPPPPPPTDLVAANEAMAAQIANLERQVQDLLHARQELEGVIESQEEEVKALRSAPPPPPPTDLVAANEAMAAQIANLERQVQDLLHARQELEGVIESQEEEVKALRSAPPPSVSVLGAGAACANEGEAPPCRADSLEINPTAKRSASVMEDELEQLRMQLEVYQSYVEDLQQQQSRAADDRAGADGGYAINGEPVNDEDRLTQVPACERYLRSRCDAITREMSQLDPTVEEDMELIWAKGSERSMLCTMLDLITRLAQVMPKSGALNDSPNNAFNSGLPLPAPCRDERTEGTNPGKEASASALVTPPTSPSLSFQMNPQMTSGALASRFAVLEAEVAGLEGHERAVQPPLDSQVDPSEGKGTTLVMQQRIQELESAADAAAARQQELEEDMNRLGLDALNQAQDYAEYINRLQKENAQLRQDVDLLASSQAQQAAQEPQQPSTDHRMEDVLPFLCHRLQVLEDELRVLDPNAVDERPIVMEKLEERQHLCYVEKLLRESGYGNQTSSVARPREHLPEPVPLIEELSRRHNGETASESGSSSTASSRSSRRSIYSSSARRRMQRLLDQERDRNTQLQTLVEELQRGGRNADGDRAEPPFLDGTAEAEVKRLNDELDTMSQRALDHFQALEAELDMTKAELKKMMAQRAGTTQETELSAAQEADAVYDLIRRLSAAQQREEQALKDVAQLEEALQSMQMELEGLRLRLCQEEQLRENDAREDDAAHTKRDELEARVVELEAQLEVAVENEQLLRDSMEQTAVSAEHRVHELEAEKRELSNTLEGLQTAASHAAAERSEMLEHISALQARCVSLDSQCESLQAQLDGMALTAAATAEQQKSLEVEAINGMTATLSEYEARTEKLEGELDAMSAQALGTIAELEAQCDELKDQVNSKTSDIELLRSYVRELESELEVSRAQREVDLHRKVQSSDRDSHSSSVSPDAAGQQRPSAISPSSDDTTGAAAERTASNETLQQQLEAAESECERLRQSLEASELDMAKQREANRQLQRSHDDISSLLSEGAAEVQQRIATLNDEKEAAESQLRSKQVEFNRVTADLREMEEELQAARAAADTCQQERRAALAEAERLRSALDQERRQTQRQQNFAADRDASHKQELERFHAENTAQMRHLQHLHAEETSALRAEIHQLRLEQEQQRTRSAAFEQQRRAAAEQLAATRQQCSVLQESNDVLRRECEAWMARKEAGNAEAETPSSAAPAPSCGAQRLSDGEEPAASTDARLAALVERNGVLEQRYQIAAQERDAATQALAESQRRLLGAAREVEIREQGLQRLERELAQVRGGLARAQEDVAQRVHMNQTLQLELDHEQEQRAMLQGLLEEVQAEADEAHQRETLLELSASLLEGKVAALPTLLEDTALTPLRRAHRDLLMALQSERADLHRRCDSIETAARTAMTDGEQQIKAYTAALDAAQEEQEAMQEMLVRLESKVREMEEALSAAAVEAEATRHSMEAAQQHSTQAMEEAELQLVEVRAEAVALRRTVDRLRAEAETTKRDASEAARHSGEETARQADTIQRLAARVEELEATRKREREAATAEVWKLREHNAVLQSSTETAKREAAALERQVAQLTPRLEQLEAERAQRTAELLDAGHQLSSLTLQSEKEGQTRSQHVDELRRTQQRLSEEVAALQKEQMTLSAERDRLTTDLQHALRELSVFESRCALLDKEHTTLTQETMRSQAEHESALFAATTAKVELEHKVSALRSRCDALTKDNNVLRTARDAAQRDKAELETALEQAQYARDEMQSQLERRLSALSARNDQLVASEKAQTKEVAALRQQGDELRQECEGHKEEEGRLEQHLEQANRQKEMLHRALQAAQQAHHTELESLRSATTAAQEETMQLHVELTRLEGEAKDRTHQYQQKVAEVERLHEELELLRHQAAEMAAHGKKEREEAQERYQRKAHEAQDYAAESRQHFATVQALQHSNAQQSDRLRCLETESAVVAERLRAVQEELHAEQELGLKNKELYRQETHTLRQSIEKLEERISQVEYERDVAQEAVRRHQQGKHAASAAARVEVQHTKEELRRVEDDLAALQLEHLQLQELATKLKHDAESATADALQAKRELQEEEKALHESQEALRTLQLDMERLRREVAQKQRGVQLQHEAERQAYVAEMEAALEEERRSAAAVRAARDNALQALERKNAGEEEMDTLHRELLADRQSLVESFEYLQQYVLSLMHMARDVALEVGLVGSADHTNGSEEGEAGLPDVDMKRLLEVLLDDWHNFTNAASTFGVEEANVEGLQCVLVSQEDAVRELIGLCHVPAAAPAPPRTSGVDDADSGEEDERQKGADSGAPAADSHSWATASGALWLPSMAERQMLDFISLSSSTFTQRTRDHVRTMVETLRQLITATAALEAEAEAGGGEDDAGGGRRHGSSLAGTRAAIAMQRSQVAATTSLLHRQAAALLRAVHRVRELLVVHQHSAEWTCGTGAVPASPPPNAATGDTSPRPRPPGAASGAGFTSSAPAGRTGIHRALQQLRSLFEEAERLAVQPFHSLLLFRADTLNSLCDMAVGGPPAGAAGGPGNRGTSRGRSPVVYRTALFPTASSPRGSGLSAAAAASADRPASPPPSCSAAPPPTPPGSSTPLAGYRRNAPTFAPAGGRLNTGSHWLGGGATPPRAATNNNYQRTSTTPNGGSTPLPGGGASTPGAGVVGDILDHQPQQARYLYLVHRTTTTIIIIIIINLCEIMMNHPVIDPLEKKKLGVKNNNSSRAVPLDPSYPTHYHPFHFLSLLLARSRFKEGSVKACASPLSPVFMRASDLYLSVLSSSSVLLRRRDTGVNQYGLKPQNSYDYINPTNLINYGRGTSFDTLGVRRSERGQIDSAPSLGGTPVFQHARLVGLSGEDQLKMCESETMVLRVCMARGDSTCDREGRLLDTCLSKVVSLRRALSQAGNEFTDWFTVNVSDNHTKPFQHRPHDWREHYAQEKLVKQKQQNYSAYGRRPKEFGFGARYVKSEGYGKRPRLPYNK